MTTKLDAPARRQAERRAVSRPYCFPLADRALTLLAAAGLAVMVAATPAAAQPANGARDRHAAVLIPGIMTGPGTFGPIGRRRLCEPRSVGLTQWRVTWVERVVKPVNAQKAALDELTAASAKAIGMFASACPKRAPRLQTSVAQLDMMEKRIEAALQAVKTVRPAFEKFYAALDDKQRERLDELGPKRSGWLW